MIEYAPFSASAVRLVEPAKPALSVPAHRPEYCDGGGFGSGSLYTRPGSVSLLQRGLTGSGATQRYALVDEQKVAVVDGEAPADSCTTSPAGQASIAAWMPAVASMAPLPYVAAETLAHTFERVGTPPGTPGFQMVVRSDGNMLVGAGDRSLAPGNTEHVGALV